MSDHDNMGSPEQLPIEITLRSRHPFGKFGRVRVLLTLQGSDPVVWHDPAAIHPRILGLVADRVPAELPEGGCGFIRSADGRDVYVHHNGIPHGGLERRYGGSDREPPLGDEVGKENAARLNQSEGRRSWATR